MANEIALLLQEARLLKDREKPLTLTDDARGVNQHYRGSHETVVLAVNAARLTGTCTILVMTEASKSEHDLVRKEYAEWLNAVVALLQHNPLEVVANYTDFDSVAAAMRVDIVCSNSTKAPA